MCQKINLAMLLDSLVINSETLSLHVVSPLVEASYNIQHLIISLNQKVTVARCPSMFSITGIWMSKYDSLLSAVCQSVGCSAKDWKIFLLETHLFC